MKKIIFLVVALFSLMNLGAVPASQKPFDITQPDGTIVTLHMIGDEYYHWTETSDNQVVIQSEEGYYEYATIVNDEIVPSGVKVSNTIGDLQLNRHTSLPNREQLVDLMMNKRRTIIAHLDSLAHAEDSSDISLNARASSNISLTKGNQKVLCVLIAFPDRSFTKTKADFQNMWNQTGYNVEGSSGSIKDFYYENSYGQMNVAATVVGPYMAQHNSTYYATTGQTTAGSKVKDLVREAIKAAKEDVQFANFDINEDKFVDAIHIVFAGYAQGDQSPSGLIWPHQGALSTSVWQNSYRAKEYFITSELAGDTGNKIAPIGTVCHEYGHQLGAPDYYGKNGFIGTGHWDIMGVGAWNSPIGFEGRYPAQHNPYTKAYIFDWVTPTIISSSVSNETFTLAPSNNTDCIYRINTSTNNEFFLLENNRSIANAHSYWINEAEGGLLIYHIHSDIEEAIEDNNINESHPQKCYIVCANATTNPTSVPSSYGNNELEYAYPYSDKTIFASYSIPSSQSWAGVSTGVNLHFIQRSGVNITFLVNPRIVGDATLLNQSTYSIPNLPTDAKIKWTYTFTQNETNANHVSGNAISFVNGDSTASVVIKREMYQHVEPTLPDPETGEVTIPRPELRYFAGTLVLKATINGGICVTTKTITLPDSGPLLPVNPDLPIIPLSETDSNTDVTPLDMEEENINVFSSNSTQYQLRYTNPISVDNSVVHIDKLSEAGDDYIPYNGNYVLEIWHDQLGLVKRIANNTSDLYLDCGSIPIGVYQIVLIVNEQIVVQSKLLKL